MARGVQQYYQGHKSLYLDATEVYKGLEKIATAMPKIVKATISDVRSRGQAWISKGVREEYNIPQSDIKSTFRGTRSNGTVKIGGVEVDNVEFVYNGRFLTPTHFDMQPKSRPFQRTAYDEYDITMKVFQKKPRKKIHGKSGKGKPFLAHASRKNQEGGKSIVFQRVRKGGKIVPRLPIDPFKTIAVPQMIQDGKGNTKPSVIKAVGDGMEKRFDNHWKRFLI